MRISDWSSDVCSSDLIFDQPVHQFAPVAVAHRCAGQAADDAEQRLPQLIDFIGAMIVDVDRISAAPRHDLDQSDAGEMTKSLTNRSMTYIETRRDLAFAQPGSGRDAPFHEDRKSTRLNSSH